MTKLNLTGDKVEFGQGLEPTDPLVYSSLKVPEGCSCILLFNKPPEATFTSEQAGLCELLSGTQRQQEASVGLWWFPSFESAL